MSDEGQDGNSTGTGAPGRPLSGATIEGSFPEAGELPPPAEFVSRGVVGDPHIHRLAGTDRNPPRPIMRNPAAVDGIRRLPASSPTVE
jgi:hypothetical protein